MKINERGYWENETREGHGVDKGLAQGIVEFLMRERMNPFFLVYDLGCGDGYYTRFLEDNSITCLGYDGNPNTEKITNGMCGVADFTVPLDKRFIKATWVLSLEVGEHIPAEFEDIFLENITTHARDGVIISWAVEGQGGSGHVNCHNNDYIIDKFYKLGYAYDAKATETLRARVSGSPDKCFWFRNTVMVFRKGI